MVKKENVLVQIITPNKARFNGNYTVAVYPQRFYDEDSGSRWPKWLKRQPPKPYFNTEMHNSIFVAEELEIDSTNRTMKIKGDKYQTRFHIRGISDNIYISVSSLFDIQDRWRLLEGKHFKQIEKTGFNLKNIFQSKKSVFYPKFEYELLTHMWVANKPIESNKSFEYHYDSMDLIIED